MPIPDPKRVTEAFLARASSPLRAKTAGEVRFIKDRGGDKNEWAWGTPGPSQREIGEDFTFKSKYLKPLSLTLRATLMAMGHAISAQNTFARIKSADVSPDGALGGKGYIAKIADMRRAYMNVVEALSALSDTLYDELKAPHWHTDAPNGGPRERQEVQEILQDAEEIREDPEGWAEEEEAEMSKEPEGPAASAPPKRGRGKKATLERMTRDVATRHILSARVSPDFREMLAVVKPLLEGKGYKLAPKFDTYEDQIRGVTPPRWPALVVPTWSDGTGLSNPHATFYFYATPEEQPRAYQVAQAVKAALRGSRDEWAGATFSRSSEADNANGNWKMPRFYFSFYPRGPR